MRTTSADINHNGSNSTYTGDPALADPGRIIRRVRIPQHVVYRSLASETVVLNVQTGIYYGLNQTAGRMLEVLASVGDLEQTLSQLDSEFEASTDVIRRDLLSLCGDLVGKGLLELESDERRG